MVVLAVLVMLMLSEQEALLVVVVVVGMGVGMVVVGKVGITTTARITMALAITRAVQGAAGIQPPRSNTPVRVIMAAAVGVRTAGAHCMAAWPMRTLPMHRCRQCCHRQHHRHHHQPSAPGTVRRVVALV
jgi:hypothetical protein